LSNINTSGNFTDDLINIGRKYSYETLNAAIAQSSLNKEQIKAILVGNGLQGELLETTADELANIASTNMVAASQAGAASSTLGLGTAFKGLGITIKNTTKSMLAWMASNPVGWLTAVVAAVGSAAYGVYKLHDALTVSLEEQKEKLLETEDAYENVKGELQEVEDELQNTYSKIKELEGTSNLTWVDREELNRLREITNELELQKQLKQDEQLDAAETLYKENKDTFDKEFKSSVGTASVSDLRDQLSSGAVGIGQLDLENNLTDAVSALQHLNEEKQKLTDENEIAAYDTFIRRITDSLKSNGQEYLSSISHYKQNILEISRIRDLTDDEQDFYAYLSSMQKTVYEFYSPATWNSLEFDSIFNTENLEKTKDELIAMYTTGKLSSEELLKSFPKLSSAIEDSELIAGEGSDKFKEFYNEIAALAEKQKDFSSGSFNRLKPDTGIPETIEQLNAQLKPAFDAVQSAWKNIFTDDGFIPENVDLSMLHSIKSTIDDLNKNKELGISIDYSSFDNLSRVLTDVTTTEQQAREALNRFVTEIFNASTATDGMTEETVQLVEQMLKSMGVSNAEEVALNALSDAKARAVIDSYNLFDASEENIASMLNEAQAAGITEEQIFKLAAAEQVFNNSGLNPKEKIEKLKELATAYGQTAIATHIANMEQASAEGHISIDYEKELASIQNAVNNSINSVRINFSPVGDTRTKTSASGAGKDTHLEEYRQKLGELQTMLDRELINEREFYDQSDALLNDYLKDTPAHLQKYADEISNAEKTLRGNWISAFGYEKARLEKDLSDGTLVRWQYYERLSELAEKYYNTEGASYGKFADEYGEITQEIKDGQEKLWDDIFGEINSQLDGLQSACETVRDAVVEYSENGSLSIDTMQKLIALEPQYMAMLFDENGQLQLNAEAYERLAKTKLEELKIDLAGQALNTINSLQSEAQAVELLTGKYAELRDTSAGAIEQQLRDAVAEAYGRGEQQGKAAETVLQAYINQRKVLDATDLPSLSVTAQQEEKGASRFLKTFDWIGTLLEKISEKTSKLIDKADRFHDWQKKNAMINRAVKSTDREINTNERAYHAYMKKANSVGLGLNYVRKIQDGALSIQDITDEGLAGKIDSYREWYDKAQGCLDTIGELYDRQRDLIKQKLDNVLDYYSDMDSCLSSITSKIESVISLNDGMGKRSPLTKLVEQFASISDRLDTVTSKGAATAGGSPGNPGNADGAADRDSQDPADSIRSKIKAVQTDLENTATYKNLVRAIETAENKIAELDGKGYENLTGGQKKKYDKLKAQLGDYYRQKKALDENATASNITEYSKTYLAWKKLQDRLDSGKNLSGGQWKQYNSYIKQLEGFAREKAGVLSELEDALGEALNPGDKPGQIEKTYGESAEDIRGSYQNQIDGIKAEAENTKQYQNLLAKAQGLEQKKDTKGLSKPEQEKLDRYNAELEALREGATGANISGYVKTWEAWYKLQQKLDSGKKLSDSEAKKYDTYKSQLEAWNSEKQTQISDLLSQMEDDLGQLQKTYTENISGAESEVNGYYANLYSLAKQIAEYSITSLQAQLDYLDAYISYYKELVSLYDTFSGDRLAKLLTDLDEDALAGKAEVYEKYLETLQDKYSTTLSEMNGYSQLLDALDTNDFEASMELFDRALEGYKANGDTAMADKLQSVLDLLNERASDADSWGESADKWAEEWEKAFSSAKQELIGTATEIQEVNDALRQIRLDNITDAVNELDTSKGILSSIADLINDDWLYDSGELSEYGRAKAALLVSQLEDSQRKANAYLDLISGIQNSKGTYASDKAYMEDLNSATQDYYNALGETASLENSIMELMKRGAEEEVSSIRKIIDARKQALQKKKEYYDYGRSLKNSQKEIDSIRAQIDAVNALGDTADAAAKAKRAQLEADLAEKEDALQETKDEHTYNLQIDALDEFAKSLEDALDSSAKSVAEILEEQNEIVTSAKELYQISSESIANVLDKLQTFYMKKGTLSDEELLELVGEPVFQYGQASSLQTSFNTNAAIPGNIQTRDIPPAIHVHYDSLIHVDGNIDKEVASLLPQQLEQSYQYTTQKLYNDIYTISGSRTGRPSVL